MNPKASSASRPTIVCLVTNDLVTDQRMQRICAALSDAGYGVTLVGRVLTHSPALKDRSFQQVRLRCWRNKGFLFYAEFNLRLLIWLLKNRFSVVNAVDLDTIIPAYFAAVLKGSKMVYDAHEWFPECPEIVTRPVVYRFWSAIERFFLPRADAVYTVSFSIAKVFGEKYQKEIGLVRNMPFRAEKVVQAKGGYLLYQGALNVGRGLPELIAAMQKIDHTLWIAGAGDIEAELRQLVGQLQIEDKVRFLGRLSPEALQEVTQNAWLGINLLENLGYNYYYSLANKFFDYVQAGVPQLCIGFPEYEKLNDEFPVAALIPDLEVSTIVAAIDKISSDPVYYQQMEAHCREAAQVWNWDREKENLLKVYEQLV